MPSQLVESSVYVKLSLYLITIMYAVIGDPLLSGQSQLITTLSPLIVEVGVLGFSGISAARIETEVELKL